MNKHKLNKVFELIKTNARLDYAVMSIDEFRKRFSCETQGIYVKRDNNVCIDWEDIDFVYIGHDIDAEQAEILIAIFQENGYDIEPKVYIPSLAFKIKEVIL